MPYKWTYLLTYQIDLEIYGQAYQTKTQIHMERPAEIKTKTYGKAEPTKTNTYETSYQDHDKDSWKVLAKLRLRPMARLTKTKTKTYGKA